MPWHLAVYDWLVRAASESLLLLVFGSLAVILIRQPARRARLITWTLGSCLVVPWLGLLPGWPRWEVGVTEEQAESAERGVRNAERAEAAEVRKKGRGEAARNEDDEHPTATNEVGPTEIAEAEARSVELPALAAPRSQLAPRWETWPRWVASAYVAGVGLMAAWWLAGIVALRRLLRQARPADERCRSVWRQLSGDAGRRTRLVVCPHVAQPITWTCWLPVVAIPSDLCEVGREQALRWSLAHEWSHVARSDAWSWTLAGVARAVFFYQPLVWWLRGRLRLEQDYLADAAAAADSPAVEDYAEFLTNLAARTFRPAVGLAMVGKKSELYRRVVMLVSRQNRLEPRCPRGWSVIAGLTTVTLVAALSVIGGAVADPEVRARRDIDSGAAPPAPSTAQADLNASPPNGENDRARRLVDALLRRSSAITSGEFLFDQYLLDDKGVVSAGGWQYRFRFSGANWSHQRQDGRKAWANDAARLLALSGDLFQPSPRLTVSYAEPWQSVAPRPPVQAGSFWFEGTRSFVTKHANDARLAGDAVVHDVVTTKLEWNIAPDESAAFGFVNLLLLQGGTLRLYVAEQLGGVLPRIENVDRFGTLQATFDADTFKEHAPGIFIPSGYAIRQERDERYVLIEVTRINEPFELKDFSLNGIPPRTQVGDARPKKPIRSPPTARSLTTALDTRSAISPPARRTQTVCQPSCCRKWTATR